MKRRKFAKLSGLGMGAITLGSLTHRSLINPIQNEISKEELLGRGTPTLTEKAGYRLRPEAAIAFERMKAAALKDGIAIAVVSSYRDYNHQNRIWTRKYNQNQSSGLTPLQNAQKIIEYSTIPGTSRHHWGTDIDLIDANGGTEGDVLVPSKFHGNGPYCEFKQWMEKHAQTFDYHLVYTDVYGRKGFKYEPWHYSYSPLSIPYLEAYKKLNVKNLLLTEKLLGSEHFTDAFIETYLKDNILSINPKLLP